VENERHIVGGIEERQQVVELEDEADLLQPHAAQIMPQPAVVVDDFAVEPHPALVRIDDGSDDVEKCALAGALRSQQADHFAG
jgi:hypothetical protein